MIAGDLPDRRDGVFPEHVLGFATADGKHGARLLGSCLSFVFYVQIVRDREKDRVYSRKGEETR